MHASGYGLISDVRAASRVIDTLRASQHVLISSHTEPDGDAVGGVLALGAILKALGKNVTLYLHDPVPFNLRFLPGAREIVSSLPPEASFDTTCIIDTNALEKVGPALPPRERLGVMVLIDHHQQQSPFADVSWVEPQSASVGELMYYLARKLSVEITLDIARCIYCAIFCDTGSFRYSCTNPTALRVAAEMVERGVDPWEMTAQIHESNPLSRHLLLGEVLRTLTLSPDGRCAAILITREMLKKTGATEDVTDGFINFARGINGVEVAVQLHELERDIYQVGFRSRGRVDVSLIARSLGGGGHKNAAGCRLVGSPELILKRIFEETSKLLGEVFSEACLSS